MKARSSQWACHSVRPFSNMSDDTHRHAAREKLGWNIARMLAATYFCFKVYEFGSWPQREGQFLFYVSVAILAFFWWKQVFAYALGFFVCCLCRRLKRAKDISKYAVQNGTGCRYCADLGALLQGREVHVSNPHPFVRDGKPLVRPPASPAAMSSERFSVSR
jgi:hypothetical protein